MTDQREGLRSIKKRMTRELIAETALQLTQEKGLENVTSDEIAQIAFVSPRTVSNYFSCKEEAVVAATTTLPEFIERYARSQSSGAPLQALRAMVIDFFTTQTHEELDRARERLQLTENNPMLLKFQMASNGQAERDLQSVIAERTGTQVGVDLYPSLAASAAVAALRTAFWVWAGSGAPDEHLPELLATAFDHIENGLSGIRPGTAITSPDTTAAAPHGTDGVMPTLADRQAAAAVVAEAVAIAREALAESAAQAVTDTGHAVATAAEKAADAAATARMDRASAAADAATAVAGDAARAAAATQDRADALAIKMSEAAARAVAIITADTTPGNDREAVLRALHVAATAEALAISTAQDTAAAAAGVADAVTYAASEVASSVSALDMAIEEEVARVAAALQTTATTIARQVATAAHSQATDVALIARGAAAAVGLAKLPEKSASHARAAAMPRIEDAAMAAVSVPMSAENAEETYDQPRK